MPDSIYHARVSNSPKIKPPSGDDSPGNLVISIDDDNVSLGIGSRPALFLLAGAMLLLGWYFTYVLNPAIFPLLNETVGLLLCTSMFAMAWYTRKPAGNSALIYLGTLYLTIGMLDFVSTVWSENASGTLGNESSSGFFLSPTAGYIEAFGLLLFPRIVQRRINSERLLMGALLVIVVLTGIPICRYLIGGGVSTGWGTFGMWGTIGALPILCIAAAYNYIRRHTIESGLNRAILGLAVLTVTGELFNVFLSDGASYNQFFAHSARTFALIPLYLSFLHLSFTSPLRKAAISESRINSAYGLQERKIAERTTALENVVERLKSNARRLGLITESINDFFWLRRADGIAVEYASRSFERLWGDSVENLYSDPQILFKGIHPDDRERVRQEFEQGALHGYSTEYRVQHPDGSVRWIRDRAFPVNEDGFIGLAGVATDITDQVLLQEEINYHREGLEKLVSTRTEELRAANRRLEADEKRLIESEHMHRRLVESLNEGLWSFDKGGKTLFANRKMAAMLGCSLEELKQKSIADFVFPGDGAWAFPKEMPYVDRGTGQFELELVRCDGTRLWTLLELSSLENESGENVGTLACVLDISSRKTAERMNTALNEINAELLTGHQSKTILRKVIEKAMAALEAESATILMREKGCWVVREQEGVLYQRNGAVLGDHEVVLAHRAVTAQTVIAIEDADGDLQAKADMLIQENTGSVLVVPILMWKTTVGVVYFRYPESSLSSEARNFAEGVGAALSLSLESSRLFNELKNELKARRRVEEELRDAQSRLSELVRRQKHELVHTRETLAEEIDQRVEAQRALSQRQLALEAVYAMATTFGTSLETLFDQVTLSIADILDIEFVSIHNVQDGRISALSQVFHGRLTKGTDAAVPCSMCRSSSGKKLLVQHSQNLRKRFPEGACFQQHAFRSIVSIPMVSGSGETVGDICAMSLEDRKFSEYEIHLVEIFARYIAHEISRTRLESKLRQSQEMELLGQLTSGVAHEVRNPLNGIVAIMEALFQDIGDNPEYDPYLMHMKNQVTRLTTLMEELLALGRPIYKEQMHSVKITAMIRASIDSWRHAASDSRDLVVQCTDELQETTIIADNAKLEQVFVNLLQNAAQHSPRDETIKVRIDHEGPEAVKISVVDRGTGISEKSLARIFEPFYTTRKAGTGLGLSIVRHIVESHGGAIDAANNSPEPGLTVSVRLPLECIV